MERTSPAIEIPARVRGSSQIDGARYHELYERSITDPEGFWSEQANAVLSWEKSWERVLTWDYTKGIIRWFEGARLNVCYNCVDRHLATRGDQVALIWEGNEPGDTKRFTFRQLHDQVVRTGEVLKRNGVKKGDRVAIYLPMIPEAVFAMLACARIGAVHSVIFAGFSSEALRDRILDCECRVLLTADEGVRGSKHIPLKEMADHAVAETPCVERVIVARHTGAKVTMDPRRDRWLHEELAQTVGECPCESMDAEDPLFILYTSGSTGKPKGVLHTQAGYLLYTAITHRYVFDYREGDIYFCAADIGWITGHSYIVYGPLANGATTVMFESTPLYPDAGRYWETCARLKVNIFYTAPTAIRAIAKEGEEFVRRHDLSSLRVLGSVGEPINVDAWRWYFEKVGGSECALVDTWWQTETGGILISPLPGATRLKPGSATKPFFGIQPCLVDEHGVEIPDQEARGRLCIKYPWPGQMRTVYGDHERFVRTYFSHYPGKYFTGDAAVRDAEGYYWITGRVDDVLLVSGHRIGTAEIESAVVRSGVVAEAAVVGIPHEIKGVGIYVFAHLREGVAESDDTRRVVRESCRAHIGALASPDVIQFVSGLPKTRSGKIMRRILRKIAEGERHDFGDISTLAEPAVVESIARGADGVMASHS